MYYILDNYDSPIKVDRCDWVGWMESNGRQVAIDTISGWRISTVFIGVDPCYSKDQAPMLFETIVMHKDQRSDTSHRYSCKHTALAAHRSLVSTIRYAVDELSKLGEVDDT